MPHLRLLVLTLLLIMSAKLTAAEHPAQSLVTDLVAQVLSVLENETDKIDSDEHYFSSRIEEIVFPHIDFHSMTRRTVGKSWKKASDQERNTLVKEFKQFLLNTYAVALTEVQGGKVEFETFKPSKDPDSAVVKSTFSPTGVFHFPVDYWLKNQDSWKIVNFVVAERNLITSYRETFAEMTKRGGVQAVIKELQKKNSGG